MPPWTTLARLPWGTILEGTAALLKRANDLRDARAEPRVVSPPSSDVDTLRQRLADLEKQQRADAEMIQQLASEIATIAAAAEATAAKARYASLIAIAGLSVAVLAAAVAWLR
jgi:hypothetical protein